MNKLPNEILEKIFLHLDIKDLGKLLCVNKEYYNIFNTIKYNLIDSMDEIGIYIPDTKETCVEYKYCIDWTQILLEEKTIPEHVLELLQEYINLDCVSTKQKFSDDFIRKYYKKLSYTTLIINQKLPIDILIKIIEENNVDLVYWKHIWKHQSINLEFIDRYIDFIDWEFVSQNKESLDKDIIIKYYDKLNWSELTKLGINEFFIEKFIDKIDVFSWYNISYYSSLSGSFILKYYDKLHINSIMHSQILQEQIIYYILQNTYNPYDLDMIWYNIALHQPISKLFIISKKDNLTMNLLISNKYIKRAWLKEIYG